MSSESTAGTTQQRAPIPRSFVQYLKSMGPGIVVILTWLSAGDLVGSATAGGNYGYALMWAFPVCLAFRCLFVSIVAKYQLCNQHGETVLGGLTRLNHYFAPFLLLSALAMGHVGAVYMVIGGAQAGVQLTQFGSVRGWAIGLTVMAFLVTFRNIYWLIEKILFVFGAMLTITLVYLAIQAGPSPGGIARGLFSFQVPETFGRFDAEFLAVSLIGAIGGGLPSMVYPYFIARKGWVGPSYRRLQQYDLALGIIVLIILDLSVWVVGAEILHPRGLQVTDLESLANLLGASLGNLGAMVFYLGIFAALFTSLIGRSNGYGMLLSDAIAHCFPGRAAGEQTRANIYQWAVVWLIFSPLVWVLAGYSDFVGLTLIVSASQIIINPVLVIGLWIITTKSTYIGTSYRNRWWENVAIGLLFVASSAGSYLAVRNLVAL